MKKITLLLALALLSLTKSNAQVAQYGFAQSDGSYTEITGGTELGLATGASYALSMDDVIYPVTLPFTFTFNGMNFSSCNVSSNGFLTFGTTAPSNTLYTPISSTGAFSGVVSGWGGDINAAFITGVVSGSMRYETIGTAPNRTFVLQYKDFRAVASTSTTTVPFVNFQIRLSETSNNVTVVYGNAGSAAGNNVSTTKQIGLRGAAASDFNNRTNAATTVFTSSTAGTANDNTQAFSAIDATPGTPSFGLTYTWTPQSCWSPSGMQFSNVDSDSATLTWTAPGIAPSAGYDYYYSTSNTPPTAATTAEGSVAAGVVSTTISDLDPLTTYYAWVRSNCGGSYSTWSSTASFTTLCVAPLITSTTPGVVCGQGSATLGVVTATGNQTWYANATGGVILGSGATFNTPQISATTDFYVSAEDVAAGTATIGAGALTGTASPYDFANGGYGGMKGQYLFTAAELAASGLRAGLINSIAVEFTTVGAALQGFSVQMGTTALTQFPTPVSILGGLTTVFTSPSVLPVVGLNTIPLTTPFMWDGSSNIVVSTCWSNENSSNTPSTIVYDNTVNFSSQSIRRDSQTANFILGLVGVQSSGSSERGSSRPKVIFGGANVATCVSPRTAVTASVATPPTLVLSANTLTTCLGSASSALTITAGNNDYDTFVWSPASGISGDAATGWVFNPSSSTTYTLTVSQSNGSCADAKVVNVVVTPLPVVQTPVSASTICSGTETTLTALTEVYTPGMVTIGNDTTLTVATAQPTAFCNRWDQYWSQTVFTKEELTAAGLRAGNITSIAYNITTLGDGADVRNFTIRVGSTANSTLNAFTTTGLSLVYGPATYAHSVGVNTINFATPYNWDGVSNIIIDVRQDGADSINNAVTYYTATSGNTTVFATSGTPSTTTVLADSNPSPSLSTQRLNVVLSGQTGTSGVGTLAWTWSPGNYTGNTVTVSPTETTTYTVRGTNPVTGCFNETTVTVTVAVTPEPVGDTEQTFTAPATVADLAVQGENVVWYASMAEALSNTNPLDANTELETGSVYFAMQTVNGCTSQTPLAVTVTVTLGATAFEMNGLKYYPNPVNSIFNVSYTAQINSVEVYNLVGQNVISVKPNAFNAAIDMSALPAGSYVLKVKSGDAAKAIKVIKR